jgi:hypothetical protein
MITYKNKSGVPDQYYVCNNGEYEKQQCPAGLHWNRVPLFFNKCENDLIEVLLNNGGSCNACTIKWGITLPYCAFLNIARDRMVLFLNCSLY